VCGEALAGAEAAITEGLLAPLDHAQYLIRLGENEAAETAIGEARGIAQRLRCQPLLDRAADLSPAEPRMRAAMVTAPGSEEPVSARDG
jgi:hypothetical protein